MIYKPTDLSPSAQTFDVKDTPIFFECKVDTSNVRANGFTIKILDSENNPVFSSIPIVDGVQQPLDIKYITLIDDVRKYVGDGSTINYNGQERIGQFASYVEGYNLVNTGLNGTYIKFPFSVAFADRATNTVGINQIFYSETALNDKPYQSGLYKYKKNDDGSININDYDSVEIYNGQEYKWSITLYQLEDFGTPRHSSWDLPENPQYYDMPLTTGTVLGSNNIRIQGVYSDEIYGDYFIQPVFINELKYDAENPMSWTYNEESTILENSAGRALIKSYDSTYGYIYPMTGDGGFAADTIIPAKNNGFRIYKRGNNPENLTAYQQVTYVCENALDDSTDTEMIAVGASWQWFQSLAAPGESYGTLLYYSKTNPNGVYKVPKIDISLQGNERIILNHQITNAVRPNDIQNYGGSPFNGIFYPQFSVKGPVDYDMDQSYALGDLVSYGGEVYSCTGKVKGKDPSAATGNYYWRYDTEQVWDSSKEAPDPIGVVQAYDSSTSYISGDMVYNQQAPSGGKTRRNYYQCRGVVRGTTPSTGEDVVEWSAVPNGYNYAITVNWFRTPDADSWGELVNKIVLVTNGSSPYSGKNLQIKDINENSDAYGTINETPFLFVTEKPVEIYKNSYPIYQSAEGGYKKGDIVQYIKPALGDNPYTEFNTTTFSDPGYKPGDVVYYTDNAYYVCIKPTASAESVVVVPGGAYNQYWSAYKAQSYYISKIDGNTALPISEAGVLSSNWAENPYLGNTGVIFYNNPLGKIDLISPTESTNGRLYIRHFDGIQPGMLLMKNSTKNEQQYVKINSYNSDYNFITYDKVYTFNTYNPYVLGTNPSSSETEDVKDGWNPADQVGAGTKYQIKTFFRESDENAFYFYTTPVVTLHYANSNGVDFIEDRVLTPKYYVDYASNVPLYDNTVVYAKDDVCKTGSSDPYRYWKAKKDAPSVGPSSDNSSSWEEVTAPWTGSSSDSSHNYTTNYNQYFSYNKDDIVLYDNKRDFLLYNLDYEYGYGDKVRDTNNNYYISIKNNNLGNSTLTDTNWWKPVTIDSSYDTTIQYIALANVPVGYAPCQEHLGLYWQQYIGVLFENEGYVPASQYYDNVNYDSSTDVLYNGLYFTVAKDNESYIPDPSLTNEHGDQVWELRKTYSSNDIYDEGAHEWGAPIAGENTLGKLCHKLSDSTWVLCSDSFDGIKYLNGLATGEYADTFDQSKLYLNTSTVFYEGYSYVVIADTSFHVPKFDVSSSADSLTEYFIRRDTGRPLNYPNSYIKSWAFTGDSSVERPSNPKRKYLMGDIALSKGSSNDCLPDRYWVKIANTDSADSSTFDLNQFIPNQKTWQPYYGPVFAGNEFNSSNEYEYNNVILDKGVSGLYFIKKNIDSNYQDMGPISPSSLPVWNVRISYIQGDKVVYNNVIYICKVSETTGQRPSVSSLVWDVYPWQLYIPEITERTLRVSADYDQQQYIQWKSAQWFLFDAQGENILEKSDVFYDGDLSYTFHGLDGREAGKDKDKFFIVRLILETYNGYRLTIDETIETMFTITEIDSEGLIDIAFDCDTASVVTTVTKESGFIVPSDMANATYDKTTAGNTDEGVMHLNGLMRYQKVAASIESASEITVAKPILSAAERFIQQIDVEIKTDAFGGELFGLRSYSGENVDADNENPTQSKLVGDFSIYIPEFLRYVDNESIYPNDSVLSKEQFITLNEYRNYLRWISSQPGTPYSDGVRIVENDGSYDDITATGDLTQFHNYKPYRTVPLYQKRGFGSTPYSETNYLPVSYEYTITSSQEGLQDKYLNVNLGYSLYRDSSDFTRDSDYNGNFYPQQDFHLIQDPLIKEGQFADSSSAGYSSSDADLTEFATAIFEVDSYDGSTEAIRVRSQTSTLWSDYVFRVPHATLVGNKGISWEDTPTGVISNTEYFTRKNVWDTVGWKWEDGTSSNDIFWADADYITSWHGYQSHLGSVLLNSNSISSYDVWFNDSNDIFDDRSNTFFKSQEPLEQSFTERKYLMGKKFLFDVDLMMDADGFITPTTIEDVVPEDDSYLKIVAYSHINTGTTNTINNNDNNNN